jgi:hypothetical protein
VAAVKVEVIGRQMAREIAYRELQGCVLLEKCLDSDEASGIARVMESEKFLDGADEGWRERV